MSFTSWTQSDTKKKEMQINAGSHLGRVYSKSRLLFIYMSFENRQSNYEQESNTNIILQNEI